MWAAIRALKDERLLGRVPPNAAAAWRKLVHNSEDLLTAGVFERLSYLEGELPVRLLLGACQVRELRSVPAPEVITEVHPWPRLEGDDEVSWREPDWVWLTQSQVIVIEAKWGRGVVPGHEQLESQQRLARRRWGRRKLFHISIVQSGAVTYPAGSQALSLTWRDLRGAIAGALRGDVPKGQARILLDALSILDTRGVAVPMMDTLPAIAIDGSLETWAEEPAPPAPAFADLPDIRIEFLGDF